MVAGLIPFVFKSVFWSICRKFSGMLSNGAETAAPLKMAPMGYYAKEKLD
jgi:hypothetical protein